jgi:hypothetical protein
MKHVTSYKISKYVVILFMVLSVGTYWGCQKENPVNPTSSTTVIDDAAASVATAIGANNGGALDQIGDIATITSAVGLGNEAGAILNKYSADSAFGAVTKSYDSTTGWWTLTLSRHRTGDFGSAEFNRVYEYQFLDKDGGFQKYWLTGTDTAYSIHFIIASGSGELQTLHIAHHLVSLSGEWLVTGTNTHVITINTVTGGDYHRVASDTITGENAVRTLNNTLTMKFIGVMVPRGGRLHLVSEVSGTITGTYHADITFSSGSLYVEKTIDKTFTITLGGDGSCSIDMGGRRFLANLTLGEIRR